MLMYREGAFDFEETALDFTLPLRVAKHQFQRVEIINLLESLVEILFEGEGPE